MTIETYQSAQDLEKVGVKILTGEACGLAMRVLCDLTPEGVELWQEFTRTTPTADAWNSSGVKSIMITSSIFRDLWIFGMVRKARSQDLPYRVFLGGYCFGNEWTETYYESLNETHRHPKESWKPDAFAIFGQEDIDKIQNQIDSGYFYISREFVASKAPGTGIDNTHLMSGRTT